jgi:hypothetical protein
MSELPLQLQVELRDAVEHVKAGEPLLEMNEALDKGDKLADEILAFASREPRRSE